MKQLYLIAGHQGEGTGAIGVIDEGKETIIIRDELAKYFKIANVFVKKDRNKDSLTAVIDWINKECKKDDLIIDIHLDSSSNKNATGTSCFIYEHTEPWVRELASKICETTASMLKIRNRGVFPDNKAHVGKLAIVRNTKCKSILLEVCFCSNPQDVKSLNEHRGGWEMMLVNIIKPYLLK